MRPGTYTPLATAPHLTAPWLSPQCRAGSSPKEIEALLRQDTSALPFLKPALLRHLERFPSTRNGLGRVEDLALRLIDEGNHNFAKLFAKFGEAEPVYGFGDLQFYTELARWAHSAKPLLELHSAGIFDFSKMPEDFSQLSFSISEVGKAVLAGDQDFVEINEVDFWLGGVHLKSDNDLWRWEEARQTLVRERGG